MTTTDDTRIHDSNSVHDGHETQVLTFTLGEEEYCVDIEYVTEIVDGGELTTLPDSKEYVEGVMDLRGRTTTILNPTEILETDVSDLVTDGGRTDHRIIVLDSEALETESAVGWLVSNVHDVRAVSEDLVDADAVKHTDLIRGLISEKDGFTIWVDPHQLCA